MKKTILTMALVAATVATSFAQGKVTFGNDSTRTFVIDTALPGDPTGPSPSGALPSGLTLVASLYAGASSGSLALQTSISLTGTDWLAPGRMANKPVQLASLPGGAVTTFQLVISDSSGTAPATLGGLAIAGDFGGSYFGTSGLFTAVPGSSIAYPFLYQTTAPVNSTWAAGNISVNAVPEPSSLVLAGLGAASLLMFRRRK